MAFGMEGGLLGVVEAGATACSAVPIPEPGTTCGRSTVLPNPIDIRGVALSLNGKAVPWLVERPSTARDRLGQGVPVAGFAPAAGEALAVGVERPSPAKPYKSPPWALMG